MSSWLARIDDNIAQLPSWARPPFYGLLIVYGMIAARAIMALPALLIVLITAGPAGILTAIWLLIVAGLAGFAGGIAFSLVHPLLRRLGRFGALATGWICVFAYLATLFPIADRIDRHPDRSFDFHDPVTWAIVAVCSLLFGSIVGQAFMPDEKGRRKRRPWLQRPSRVTSRVHPPAT